MSNPNTESFEDQLTPEQLRILRVFWETDHDMCYPYSFFEVELGRTRAELVKEFAVLRKLGYIYYARGLMDDDGQVAGSGYGVRYEKLKEIEALLPPHEHDWKIYGDKLHCVMSHCYEWKTLPQFLSAHQATTDQRVAEAQTNAVAWAVGVIDELHTVGIGEIDGIYKGIKNTLRDRYKAHTGIDPAPSYPVDVKLSPHTEQEEDQS